MGIFGWNGARGLPPLDGDDENRQHGAQSERPANRPDDQTQDLFATIFGIDARDEYARLFHALATHMLVLLGAPSWWQRYTPAQRREAESLIRAHSAPLLSMTQIDDQCAYCRRVLAEQGEELPEVDEEFRAYGGYLCEAHLVRLSAHKAACAEINDLLAPHPSAPLHTTSTIAHRFTWGYLGDRLPSDFRPFP